MNCMKPKFLIPLGVVAIVLVLVAPGNVGRFAPLLVIAACPLSMGFMMRRMSKSGQANGSGADEVASLRREVAALKQAGSPAAPGVNGHTTAATDR